MTENRGFTLIETLVSAAVLACGLAAVASVFSFAVRATITSRQVSVATVLLYDKMEEFRSASLTDPVWTSGDGSDQVSQDVTYIRMWRIGTASPRSVTVIVYGPGSPPAYGQKELARATTLASAIF